MARLVLVGMGLGALLLVFFKVSSRKPLHVPSQKEISHASAVSFETAEASVHPSRNDAQSGFVRRSQLMKMAMLHLRSNPVVAARYAERLLELSQDDYSALRVALVARYQEARKTNDSKSWGAVENLLDQAKRQGYQDELFLAEMEYWIAVGQGNEGLVRDQIKTVSTKYPAFGMGQFLAACTELKNQNESGARRSFRLAAEIEPEQKRYREAYDASKTDITNQYVGICDVPPWEWPEWSDTDVK